MTELPLFPLGTLLLPHGRLPLQIFERRYIDMISACMREGTGFGVVWIRTGSEVAQASKTNLELGAYGTVARSLTGINYPTVCWVSPSRADLVFTFKRLGARTRA